jgi:hypothetical protein
MVDASSTPPVNDDSSQPPFGVNPESVNLQMTNEVIQFAVALDRSNVFSEEHVEVELFENETSPSDSENLCQHS